MRSPSFMPRNAASLWLVLALFVLKAIVPQGFMPATQQSGTLIQLCSAAGPIWVAGPAKHDEAPDERHAAQAASCPMGAALAAVSLPPSPVLLAAAASVMAHPLAARAPPRVADGSLSGAPLGARAPPALTVSR
ncbi:DUF2946 family protein [Achromobacter deleyi]|uniref:DUF2946 family protein n=1 Tax=Achromobacter deleyi TaxID=1353891 RepID=UPI00149288D3|nr:DUF2946 family protein [Achromobacter deleyi]QVQ28148.1 DUF2946 domain-containing protein [Achromobacter deleyi]UIP18337.1 DUF2946 family protein [Achromobacter deleyi]